MSTTWLMAGGNSNHANETPTRIMAVHGRVTLLLIAVAVVPQLPPTLAALPPFVAEDAPSTNVRLRCPQRTHWVRKKLEGAALRLSRPECGRVLSEFQDASGQPLQANLDALGLSASDYLLNNIFLYDADEGVGACRRSATMAMTEPGSRVVRLCPRFAELRRQDPARTEALLIHEALHTLGLGENPPSSREITDRVLQHCR